MPLNLAHHLKISRCGIFYFRMSVPAALRLQFGKREILHSLRTRSPAVARKLAYHFAFKTYSLFEQMAYDPRKFNPADVSSFPTPADIGSLGTYKAKIGNVEFETDGSEEEHRRVLEMVNALPVAVFAPAPQAPVLAPTQQQPQHTITLSKAAATYLPTLANIRTRKMAERAINRFIEHRGDVEIHTVTGVDVVEWNNKLLTTPKPNGDKPSAWTVDCSIQILHNLLQWAYDKLHSRINHKACHGRKAQPQEEKGQGRCYDRSGSV